MNNRYVTCIISTNINDHLTFICNTFAIIMEHKLFNQMSTILAVIGRPMHRMADIASSHLRYKIYTYVLCLKLLSVLLVDQPNGKLPALLPWCTAIAGYQISSDNSNSQQQPTSSYKQTSKSIPGAVRQKV